MFTKEGCKTRRRKGVCGSDKDHIICPQPGVRTISITLANLKSYSALKSNKGHNLLKSVFPSNKQLFRSENLFLSHLTKRWDVYKGVRLGR